VIGAVTPETETHPCMTNSSTLTISEHTALEMARATDVIASAFCGDPMIGAILRGRATVEIKNILSSTVPSFVRTFEGRSLFFLAEKGGLAIGAAIMPVPDSPPVGDLAGNAFADAFLTCGTEAELESFGMMGGSLGDHSPNDEYHLSVLGVHLSFQGQGVGTALMNHLLAITDSNGKRVNLSVYTPENLNFYPRFGFEAVHHETILGVGAWHMRRSVGGETPALS
jgi:GNAT superfamily N-acetyltransferase